MTLYKPDRDREMSIALSTTRSNHQSNVVSAAIRNASRLGITSPKLVESIKKRAQRDYDVADFFMPSLSRVHMVARVPQKYYKGVKGVYEDELDKLASMPQEERYKLVVEKALPKTKGKRKTGHIPYLSMPAMVSCPGRTALCRRYCYAAKGNYALDNNIRARLYSLLAFMIPGFGKMYAERIGEELSRRGIKFYRLHDSGDIWTPRHVVETLRKEFGVENPEEILSRVLGFDINTLPQDIYVKQLADLIDTLAKYGVQVYTYTRSWRDPEIWSYIEKHLLPKKNFVLYLSIDKTMPREEIERAIQLSKKYPNVKLAFTGFYPEDLLKKHGVTAKICPQEAQKAVKVKLAAIIASKDATPEQKERAKKMLEQLAKNPVTCDKCQICPLGKANVVFPIH